jgi:formylglycine-generating enzyme required for sulfatase activity/serine/threonine protein kinase
MDSTESVGSLPKAFGRYRVEKVLGEGAMGMVYLARDSKLDRPVALKVPKFDDDPEMMERFWREARSAATLLHRNICPVHDIGDIDGVHYISMAYIAGRPLSALIDRSRPQSQRSVSLIVRKLALALETAHQAGVIHRDLKPANVMLDQQNEPVIMDFGLARQLNKKEDSRLTQSGSLMGSPAYMSPEQVKGDIEHIGPTSDIYSLGVFLYEFLTGEVPFDGPASAVFGQILTQEPQKPSTFRADLDPRLEAICLKMIAKQIEERYGSMREAAKALSDFLKDKGQQPESASGASFQTVAIDSSPRNETVKGEAQHQTLAGERTVTPTSQTVPGLRGAVQSASVKFSNQLARLPGWAKGVIGTVLVLLLIYSISLPFRADEKPVPDDPNPYPPVTAIYVPPPPAKAPFNSIEAQAHQRGWAKHLDTAVETTNSIGMKMVLIPPGEFTMGSTQAEIEKLVKSTNKTIIKHNHRSEGPQHQVTLTKPFYLGVHEVTQAEYQLVMGGNPSHHSATGKGKDKVAGLDTSRFPVDTVSWLDAVDFCNKLSEREGLRPFYLRTDDTVTILDGNGYRLPSEAEWEFACRAGTQTRWSFGKNEQELPQYGWFDSNSGKRTHSVGKRRGNPFGLYDMYGNLREWCQDWHAVYGREAATTDPTGPAQEDFRVLRGGAIGNSPSTVRSAYRTPFQPDYLSHLFGFRVARAIAPAGSRLEKIREFIGHTKPVQSVAFSPDGKYALSGGDDNILRLWDVETGLEVRYFEGHTNTVFCVDFSHDGKTVVSSARDWTIRVWNVADGKLIRRFDVKAEVRAVAFSPDGQRIISGAAFGKTGFVNVWSIKSGTSLRRYNSPSSQCLTVAVSPDGKSVASGGSDGRVEMRDLATGEVRRVGDHSGLVTSVKFMPNGQTLIARSNDGKIRQWDVSNGKMLNEMLGSPGWGGIAISRNGEYCLSAGKESLLWDLRSATLIDRVRGETFSFGISFGPVGQLALISVGNTVQLWKLPSRNDRVVQVHAVDLLLSERHVSHGPDDLAVDLLNKTPPFDE